MEAGLSPMAGRNCTPCFSPSPLTSLEKETDVRPPCRPEPDDFGELVLVLVKVAREFVAGDHSQREEVDGGVFGIGGEEGVELRVGFAAE